MCSTLNHPLCGCATTVIQKSPFHYNRGVQATIRERKGDFMAKQTNSLAHTGKYTAEDKRVFVHGISEREKCVDDV